MRFPLILWLAVGVMSFGSVTGLASEEAEEMYYAASEEYFCSMEGFWSDKWQEDREAEPEDENEEDDDSNEAAEDDDADEDAEDNDEELGDSMGVAGGTSPQHKYVSGYYIVTNKPHKQELVLSELVCKYINEREKDGEDVSCLKKWRTSLRAKKTPECVFEYLLTMVRGLDVPRRRVNPSEIPGRFEHYENPSGFCYDMKIFGSDAIPFLLKYMDSHEIMYCKMPGFLEVYLITLGEECRRALAYMLEGEIPLEYRAGERIGKDGEPHLYTSMFNKLSVPEIRDWFEKHKGKSIQELQLEIIRFHIEQQETIGLPASGTSIYVHERATYKPVSGEEILRELKKLEKKFSNLPPQQTKSRK